MMRKEIPPAFVLAIALWAGSVMLSEKDSRMPVLSAKIDYSIKCPYAGFDCQYQKEKEVGHSKMRCYDSFDCTEQGYCSYREIPECLCETDYDCNIGLGYKIDGVCNIPKVCDKQLGICVDNAGHRQGMPCNDNDGCTVEDACNANGQCAGQSKCPDGEICDEDNDDRCVRDLCESNNVDCAAQLSGTYGQDAGCYTAGRCDPVTGKCGAPTLNCASENLCKDGQCVECASDDQCDSGVCENNTCVECREDKHCDDSVDCTDDSCSGNVCQHTASMQEKCRSKCEDVSCEWKNLCYSQPQCDEETGGCQKPEEGAYLCDDKTQTCDPDVGCVDACREKGGDTDNDGICNDDDWCPEDEGQVMSMYLISTSETSNEYAIICYSGRERRITYRKKAGPKINYPHQMNPEDILDDRYVEEEPSDYPLNPPGASPGDPNDDDPGAGPQTGGSDGGGGGGTTGGGGAPDPGNGMTGGTYPLVPTIPSGSQPPVGGTPITGGGIGDPEQSSGGSVTCDYLPSPLKEVCIAWTQSTPVAQPEDPVLLLPQREVLPDEGDVSLEDWRQSIMQSLTKEPSPEEALEEWRRGIAESLLQKEETHGAASSIELDVCDASACIDGRTCIKLPNGFPDCVSTLLDTSKPEDMRMDGNYPLLLEENNEAMRTRCETLNAMWASEGFACVEIFEFPYVQRVRLDEASY